MVLPNSLQLQSLIPALDYGSQSSRSSVTLTQLRLMDEIFSSFSIFIRERLNQATAVNQLPPEVLNAIFDLVRCGTTSEDTAHEIPALQAPDCRSLIVSSQVCRYWRNVALASPALWTDIVAYSTSAATFAQRAGRMPLTISVRTKDGKLTKTQKRVLWRFRSRIRALSVTVESREELRVFRKLFRELAPVIQALSIVVGTRWAYRLGQHEPTATLFGAPAPSLKALSVSSPHTFVPMDPYPALAHLHLRDFRRGIFGIDLLVGLFRNTPVLRTFHLHLHPRGMNTLTSRRQLPAPPPIPLRVMDYFCITALRSPLFIPFGPPWIQCYGINDVLSAFTFPQGAFISIQEKSGDPSGLCVLDPGPSALTLDESGTTFVAHGASYSDPRCTYFLNHSGRLTPHRVVRASYPPLLSLPDATRAAFRTVRTLRIQSSWHSHVPFLAACTRMPALMELVLRDLQHETLPYLIRLLMQTNPVLCPRLETVVYITLDFAGQDVPGAFALASDTLFSASTHRATVLGRRLARLVFCSPRNTVDRILRDAHGAERVEVLGRDIWEEQLESTHRDIRDIRTHQRAVSVAWHWKESSKRETSYESLWRVLRAR